MKGNDEKTVIGYRLSGTIVFSVRFTHIIYITDFKFVYKMIKRINHNEDVKSSKIHLQYKREHNIDCSNIK